MNTAEKVTKLTFNITYGVNQYNNKNNLLYKLEPLNTPCIILIIFIIKYSKTLID